MSRSDARRLLVAYDIQDDRRRARLATLLQRYGERVQYSVFVVDVGAAPRVRLTRAVNQILDHPDSVLIADLGPATPGRTNPKITFMGRRPTITGDSPLVF